MSLKIEWVDGAPEELQPGMVIMFEDDLVLIGHCNSLGSHGAPRSAIFHEHLKRAKKWGWLAQPHELEWLRHMAGREAKARPEE